MFTVCGLIKRKGLYVIGPSLGTTRNAAEALTNGRRQAARGRWCRLIPHGEITQGDDFAVLRAWDTRNGSGIAVITDTPERVRQSANAAPASGTT